MHIIAFFLCGLLNVVFVGGLCGNFGPPSVGKVENPRDGACGSIDIRNNVEGFKKLENCTVIEGNLHILLIDHTEQKDYEKFQFPLLKEITGHLLLYRVYGLKTLRHIFPNLAVIRGQDLFYNYALVAYEMPDLEEIGLVSLNTIMRGAVRLTKNNKLCYVDTIDWSRIAVGLKESDHHIQENKDETECVNHCPEDCSVTKLDGKEARRCWTSQHCQKNLDCHCGSNSSACVDGGNKCCNDKNCLGGCTETVKDGKKEQKCIACRNVIYKDLCIKRCPPTTFMFMKRRCLSAQECSNLTRKGSSPNSHWLLFKPDNKELPAECVSECPTGYLANEELKECVKCNKSCPKVCGGKVVDSIDSAQHLKGCNKIQGPLEIKIMGGSNIGIELEESLGDITEVTQYIKVARSYALLSLHFFKSLEIIGGLGDTDSASLVIRDNSNLQELFTDEVTKRLKILKGKVNIHGNRKLCLSKIDTLVENLGLTDNITEVDVSRTTNGDLMPCSVTKLNVTIDKIMKDLVVLQWPKVQSSDERQILAYVINYREVTSDSVNIYQGRDACSETIWKTIETSRNEQQQEDQIMTLVSGLKPWTKYAVYVQAVMLNTASNQAISDILIFTTSPYLPTSPTDLRAVAERPGELLVSWKPPKVPNGNVTHYYVYWQLQELDSEPFDQRDYCKNPIVSSKDQTKVKDTRQNKNETKLGANCCACPKSKEELKQEERERQIEIEFENYLHENVYCKRRSNSLPVEIDKKYNLLELVAMKHRRKRASEAPSSLYTAEANRGVTTTTASPNSTEAAETNHTQENAYLHLIIYDTKIPLTNLGHYQEYSIEVLACQETDPRTWKKYCSNRAITVARTLPLEKADNINASTVEAKLIANSTGEVMIKWEPPKHPNGLIIKYLIRYRRANQDDHEFLTICVSQRKYKQHGGHRLVNIDPGNYTFHIAAVSLAGNGSYTPLMYFVIPPRAESPETINEAVIAVTVISSILVIIIIVIVVWFIAKSRFTNQDMTVISPNPGYMPSDNLYIPDDWEVPRDKIKLLNELGQGSFGMVYQGKAYDLVDGYPEYKVAVKTVNENAGYQERMNFLKEATTMKTFNCYHVVKLIGVVSKGQPALVIMELMANGDLKNFLRMHRPDEDDCIGDPPSVKEILQMAGEIADGMAYLSANKYVHRDLAARNCMVSENKVVKIGDFGMTRDIYETDYYRKGNKGLLPVRWMAPESLKDGVFTTMSDVWSYGIVMWEMATLAAQPYQGLANEQVVKFVSEGKTMEQPPGCPPKVWSIMQKCWRYKPKHRPTFMSIIEELVPDLDPNFQNVSYFFSEESHADGEGENSRSTALSAHNAGLDQDDDDDDDYDEDDGDIGNEFLEDEIDDVGFAGMDSHEESRIPFMAAEDISHHHHHHHHDPQTVGHVTSAHHSPSHGNRGASSSSSWVRGAGASRGPTELVAGAGAGSGSGSPVECVMMEELPNGHRFSACSSPTSANAPSDDSKGSSKSSGSFSHMNGLANGHIYNPYSHRTKPC
ncbi:LOW QUALITY PROTEIN: putative molluscan insulin-related peptide(s) receptor [Babylonia areolata]|uniref:LOW QUALITY PROTEIN: putative molluscan insulin-related peptide(s) receptor n=1 Tax=Babylonia areolata TaxID=304850 RepID=UPI003FD54669